MNFSQLLEVLAGRFKVILLITVGLAAAMFLLASLMPKKYMASASILVDARSADALASGSVDRSQAANQSLMATQAAVIASDRVARRVVTKLKLDAGEDAKQQWMEATEGQGDLNSFIAAGLLRRLEVLPGRDSNVIRVSFVARDPKFAMNVVNAFAEAALETNLELKVEPARQFASWFDARTEILRKQLEAAQRKLTDYQREKGLFGVAPGQIDIENAKLAQLAAKLVEVQASRSESNSRQEQARGDATTSPDVINNTVIATLRGNIAAAEAQLKVLGAQFGDQHPNVISARDSLAELKAQLQAEMRSVARSVTTANTVNEQRVAEARAAVDAQRARVASLMNSSNDLVVLQSGVESVQRALDAATTRQSQTSLESQVQQTNVYLLAPATEPFEPAGPKVGVFTVCAAAFGLLLGIGVALWRESRNPLIRSAEDLGIVVDLPVMATLPHADLRAARADGADGAVRRLAFQFGRPA